MVSRDSHPLRPRPIELLAPAGSTEAFFAALENGADAVYCGLRDFSARAKAKNFTLSEVERLSAFAHGLEKKLFVTLNTLIKERELPRLIEILAGLALARVDGIIIQDLGVYRLARNHFPGLPLHASTQMAIHNGAGVRMLEQMGFTRAVLARELSIEEIAAIRRESKIELEHFVHGALCYSISGQCFFSSSLQGMSGNRGRCAQPCRRRFQQHQQTGYYFSTSDFCAIELLPELIKAGVTSFKIEGRMKSAEYVARVVAAYRLMLDTPESERKQSLEQAKEHLALSFGRETTKGFLRGFVPSGITLSSRQGMLGQVLGTVANCKDGMIGLKVADRLHTGDRVRIQPHSDQTGFAFTVRELLVEGKPRKLARPGDFVRIPLPVHKPVRPGDTVLKTGGRQIFTTSPAACAEQLAALQADPLPPAAQEAIRTRAGQALAALLPAREHRGVPAQETLLTVRAASPADLHLLDLPEVSFLELPLSPENLHAAAKLEKKLCRYRDRLCWVLPPMLFADHWTACRKWMRILAGQGYRDFCLGNLGHFPLFAGVEGVRLTGDFRCYTINSQAALTWGELGLKGVTTNLEDERDNMAALCHRALPVELMVTAYAPLPLLLSRIPQRMRPGTSVQAEQGDGFRVYSKDGLTELRAEQDFSLLGQPGLDDLRCRRLRIDCSHCGSKRIHALLAALQGGQPLPDTTPFNFLRGLA